MSTTVSQQAATVIEKLALTDPKVKAAFKALEGVNHCDDKAEAAATKNLDNALQTKIASVAKEVGIKMTRADVAQLADTFIEERIEGRTGNGLTVCKPATSQRTR